MAQKNKISTQPIYIEGEKPTFFADLIVFSLSTQKDCVSPIFLCTAIQENLKAFRNLR